MTADVLKFPERPTLEVLARAHEAELECVIVLGWTKAGKVWSDTCMMDGANALWLLEEAKRKVMEAGR